MQSDGYKEWWRPAVNAGDNAGQLAARPESAVSGEGTVPFWALIAFTCILLLAPQHHYPVLAPLRIAMLTAVVAILAHVLSCMKRGRPVIQFTQGEKYALLLAGWAVMTVPLSLWAGGSIDFLVSNYFKTLVVFLLLANVIDSLPKLVRLSWALVLISIPLALTTVRNFATGAGLPPDETRVVGYQSALTENPNDMALMLNIILPFCIALFLGVHGVTRKLFLGAVICLLVAAVIATFSRAGFLTLGMIFIAYMWLLRKRPQFAWAPVALLVALMALPFIPDTYSDRVGTITDIEADESGSAQVRVRDMEAATGLVFQRPLTGSGVGTNALALNEARGETWTEVHNVYLQYAVELGLPGLVLFLLLYAACMKSTGEVLRRAGGGDSDQQNMLYFMAEAIRVSLVAFAISAFFYPVAYHFYFYYIAGLAVAIRVVGEKELVWTR